MKKGLIIYKIINFNILILFKVGVYKIKVTLLAKNKNYNLNLKRIIY